MFTAESPPPAVPERAADELDILEWKEVLDPCDVIDMRRAEPLEGLTSDGRRAPRAFCDASPMGAACGVCKLCSPLDWRGSGCPFPFIIPDDALDACTIDGVDDDTLAVVPPLLGEAPPPLPPLKTSISIPTMCSTCFTARV